MLTFLAAIGERASFCRLHYVIGILGIIALAFSRPKGASGPLRHSWRTVMTKEANGTGPDLIVLGRDNEGNCWA